MLEGVRDDRENKMFIASPTIEEDSGYTLISSRFHINERVVDIWFRTKAGPVNAEVAQDAFLAAVLIPAMKIGGRLTVEDPISPRLHRSIATIQQIITKWYKGFSTVEVVAQDRAPEAAPRARSSGPSAQFFSGGVDSFYTMLKNRAEIQDLYFVHGFDLFLNMKEGLKRSSRQLNEAADVFGKNLLEIETNIHRFSMEFAHWPAHYHGSAMASMAMLMSLRNPKFHFASTHSYADLFPWGSHPLLDPLWSTEYVEIVHDGAEATRLEKVYSIVKESHVLDYLRVGCGGANCRRTEKCLRTMIALDLAGVLDRAKTFGHPLELEDIARIEIKGDNQYSFVMENYRELLKRPDKKKIRRALRTAIQNYQNKSIAHGLKKNIASIRQSELFQSIRDMLAD